MIPAGRSATGRADVPRLARVYRRAYALLIGIAVIMGVLAIVAAVSLDKPLVDPDGFLGPVLGPAADAGRLGASCVDLLPRTLWRSRLRPRAMPRDLPRAGPHHWTRDRIDAGRDRASSASTSPTSATGTSSRSCRSSMGDTKYDRELHLLDRALLFGHDPAVAAARPARHRLLGALPVLRLPVVPAAGAAGADRLAGLVAQPQLRLLVRHLPVHRLDPRHGRPTTRCPRSARASSTPGSTRDLPDTPASSLMDSLLQHATTCSTPGIEGAVQSVAGFASLHCAITLLVALMVQFTLRNRVLKSSSGSTSASPWSPPSTSAGTTSPTTSPGS